MGDIAEDFRHQLGSQREDYLHKIDLVVEGQQMLAEKVGRVEGPWQKKYKKSTKGYLLSLPTLLHTVGIPKHITVTLFAKIDSYFGSLQAPRNF